MKKTMFYGHVFKEKYVMKLYMDEKMPSDEEISRCRSQVIEKFKEEIVDKSKKLFDCINNNSCKENFNKCEEKEICISCGYNQYCKLN